ncbi:two-component system, OmpR family, sensor histidine kinase BaeS [Pseudoalteromonas denitrificans DSM 6059]|uniref:histidine kinase n=2 Tax=Pseudoalteromonas TaxID=53246 RepID=A0A1I1LIV1_9GAMM|nr:two-component system, OmpR family, sensor histidine kinase BaeS [Pseudoalteromonas denitrificans DSM 6059]
MVASLVLLMQWSLGKGMIDYVNTKEVELLKPLTSELTDIYKKSNSWSELENRQRQFQYMINLQLNDSEFESPKKNRPHRRHDQKRPPLMRGEGKQIKRNNDGFFEQRRPPPKGGFRAQNNSHPPKPPEHRVSYAVLDANKNYVVGHYIKDREYAYTPIVLDAITVGYLVVSKRNKLTQGYELDFIKEQQSYIWFIALGMMLFVIIITLPLARHLVQPIRQLTLGMHKLTQGNYKQNLDVKRQDEFGQLSRDFNELSKTLEQNETARKRWLANISHELRTPVAILKGEIEAMLDGVRPLSLGNIKSTQEEVTHLQNLIEDLHQLTSADIGAMKYRKQESDLTDLVDKESARYQGYIADAGLKFKCQNAKSSINVYIDHTRICQLLDNLINNAIKYAITGTQIKLCLLRTNKMVQIIVEDDGPGVEDTHLPHLFEHLYRVDNSRNRETGGTGLGLSICAHIVEAHQGSIEAKKSDLGGLKVIIHLPLS